MRLTRLAAATAVSAAALLSAVPAHAGRPAPVIADISNTLTGPQFTPVAPELDQAVPGTPSITLMNLSTINIQAVPTVTYQLVKVTSAGFQVIREIDLEVGERVTFTVVENLDEPPTFSYVPQMDTSTTYVIRRRVSATSWFDSSEFTLRRVDS